MCACGHFVWELFEGKVRIKADVRYLVLMVKVKGKGLGNTLGQSGTSVNQ